MADLKRERGKQEENIKQIKKYKDAHAIVQYLVLVACKL